MNKKIIGILACTMMICSVFASASALTNKKMVDTIETVQLSSTSTRKDPELPITITPPYDEDEDMWSIFAWTDADKSTGQLDGAAGADVVTPYSWAEGRLIEYHEFDEDHLDDVFIELHGHLSGHITSNLLWTSGIVGFNLAYEIYRGNSLYTDGTIFEEWIEDTPLAYWDEEFDYDHTVHLNNFKKEYQYRIEVILTVLATCESQGYCGVVVASTLDSIVLSGWPDLTSHEPYIWWYTDDGVLNPGDWVGWQTGVINMGHVSTRGDNGYFEVRFWDDGVDKDKGSKAYSVNDGWLQPWGCTCGGPVYVSKSWYWHNDMNYHTVMIKIDPDDDVYEKNHEDNNVFSNDFAAPVCGLTTVDANNLPTISIKKPAENFIYTKNEKGPPSFRTLIFGSFDVEVDAENFDWVEFHINGDLKAIDCTKPYTYTVSKDKTSSFKSTPMTIMVKAYDKENHLVKQDSIDVIAFL